jgi:hypothetical protein
LMETPEKFTGQPSEPVVELAQLRQVEIFLSDEIFRAMGIEASSLPRKGFGPIFSPFVRRSAQFAVDFDHAVALHGFQKAAQDLVGSLTEGIQVLGNDQIPHEGPLLIAANHPGTFDSLAIASIVPRQDLRIIVGLNPLFYHLPNARNSFIYATNDSGGRMETIRSAIRHLNSGGAILTFPSGHLDPDPLHFPAEAKAALSRWSASSEIFLRKVPEARLITTINSGFVDPVYIRNPITRIRSTVETRQRLAEVIQIIQHIVFKRKISCQPRILFGQPVAAVQLLSSHSDVGDQIRIIASGLLDAVPSSSMA